MALPVPELCGQFMHAAKPVTFLNVSVEQAVGVPPFGPLYPLSATQAVLLVEPVAPTVPELVGQLKQESGLMEKAVIDHASLSSLALN